MSFIEEILNANFNIKYYLCQSAKEAFEFIAKNRIDLILSDINMPQIDGFKFHKLLKAKNSTENIPLIFMTAKENDTDKFELDSFTSGAIDFIVKPINKNIYIAKIRNYIQLFELQRSLEEEKEFNQKLLNLSEEAQIVIDTKENKILSFNKKSKETFSEIKENIILNELFVDKQEFGAFFDSIKTSNKENIIVKFEDKYFRGNCKKINDKKMLSFLDITKEIKEKTYFETILNISRSIILVTDGKTLKNINKRFFDIFDFKDLNDFKSKHNCICELFIEKKEGYLMPEIEGYQWNLYVQNNPKIYHKACIIDKDGNHRVFQVQSSGKLFKDNEEEVITFTEITTLLKSQELLEEQTKHAAMGEMISMIAHQWRQPLSTLSVINSKVKIMAELNQLDDKMLYESFEKSNSIITHLSNTIEDFRNFFHKDGSIESLELSELINKTYNILETSFKEQKIIFKVNYKNSIDTLMVKLDLSKFSQVLLNLLKNAYDELIGNKIEKKMLTIKCYLDENWINIEVKDNANGIPENIIGNIFEPYFSTKSKNGTGLGLYMSKIIIEEHLKGHLSAKNSINGASFKIQLPKSLITKK